jgi:NTE family protein
MNDRNTELGSTALVFAGGVGLGAYQAGAYAWLYEQGVTPRWTAGSSIGAVNAVLIAGNPPEQGIPALRAFSMPDGNPLNNLSRPGHEVH